MSKKVKPELAYLIIRYAITLVICTVSLGLTTQKPESRRTQMQKYLSYKFRGDSIQVEKIKTITAADLFKRPETDNLIKEMRACQDTILQELVQLEYDYKSSIESSPGVKFDVRWEISIIRKKRPPKAFINYFMNGIKNTYSQVFSDLKYFLNLNDKNIELLNEKINGRYTTVKSKIYKTIHFRSLCADEYDPSMSFLKVTFKRNNKLMSVIVTAYLKCHLYCLATDPKEE